MLYSHHSIPNISGNKLTLDNLGRVLDEILDVSTQWYLLGLQLNVQPGTLDSIQAQYSEPKRQLLEMLKTWLTTGDNPSWKILIEALKCRSVGANQLAGVLETKYCPVEGTNTVMGMSAKDSCLEANVSRQPHFSRDTSGICKNALSWQS